MNGIEAEQAEAFLAVIEFGSFTAAGRKLGRDGSIISRRIAALEARLGIRLLERSTRRVAPTEAGAHFRDRLRQAMDILHAAEDEARARAIAPAGLLRISLPQAFGRMWVAPRLPAFLAQYPALRVEASYTDRFVDLIAEGFDVGIRIGELQDSRLVARRLTTSRRLLCAAPAYLAQRPPLKVPLDLLRHDCICFTKLHTHPVWHMQHGGKDHAVRVTSRLDTDDADAMVHAALAGIGIILATDWLVSRELAEGRLIRVLPDYAIGGGEIIQAVRASVQHQPAKSRAFVDWIGHEFATSPWPQTPT